MGKEAQSHNASAKYLQTGLGASGVPSWLSHRGAKGLGCHAAQGSTQRHFPVGVLYLSQPSVPSKSRPLASKISTPLANFILPGARAGLGHTIKGLWDLVEMNDASEPLVSVTAGAGGTSWGGTDLLDWLLTGGAGTCGTERHGKGGSWRGTGRPSKTPEPGGTVWKAHGWTRHTVWVSAARKALQSRERQRGKLLGRASRERSRESSPQERSLFTLAEQA